MNSKELENLVKLRDILEETLSSKIFLCDENFLGMYQETDQRIAQEKIETIGL